MATNPRPLVGAWTGRLVGVAFVLVGLAVLHYGLTLWLATHEVGGIDLRGVLMVGIGLGLIWLWEIARKVAIFVALFYVVCSVVPLWSVARSDQGWTAAAGVLATAIIMAVSTVTLLLPATRMAFQKHRAARAKDEEPLLNTAR